MTASGAILSVVIPETNVNGAEFKLVAAVADKTNEAFSTIDKTVAPRGIPDQLTVIPTIIPVVDPGTNTLMLL